MFSQNLAVQIVLTCLPRTGSAHSILSYKSLTTGLVIRNFQTVKRISAAAGRKYRYRYRKWLISISVLVRSGSFTPLRSGSSVGRIARKTNRTRNIIIKIRIFGYSIALRIFPSVRCSFS